MFEPFMTQLKALFQSGAKDHQHGQSLAIFSINLRNAAASVRAAQIALARAKAEQQLDRKRLANVDASIEDLENRAKEALRKGIDALAREAAEAIALLEDEKTTLEKAIRSFDQELVSLTEALHRAQSRLRALKRGERTAEVRERIQNAQSLGSASEQSALARAEDQLDGLLRSQERDRLADQEFKALSPADRPETVIEKLGRAGCGDPVRSRADDVLARLKSDTPLLIENAIKKGNSHAADIDQTLPGLDRLHGRELRSSRPDDGDRHLQSGSELRGQGFLRHGFSLSGAFSRNPDEDPA